MTRLVRLDSFAGGTPHRTAGRSRGCSLCVRYARMPSTLLHLRPNGFRPADLFGRLAHRELPTTTDLTALTALEHVPVDPICRRDVLVADLGSHVVLVGSGGE